MLERLGKIGEGSVMEEWQRFKSVKEQGEWAELQFMAAAAGRRFTVCKPWETWRRLMWESNTRRTFFGCR